jgi:hypothetical protein
MRKNTPILNKDLLLPFYSFGERGNTIFVSIAIDLELEEGSTTTKGKKMLELKICKRLSWNLRDGVQED